jgi:hypothetical protein
MSAQRKSRLLKLGIRTDAMKGATGSGGAHSSGKAVAARTGTAAAGGRRGSQMAAWRADEEEDDDLVIPPSTMAHNSGYRPQVMIYGVERETDCAPGEPMVVDGWALGYPLYGGVVGQPTLPILTSADQTTSPPSQTC